MSDFIDSEDRHVYLHDGMRIDDEDAVRRIVSNLVFDHAETHQIYQRKPGELIASRFPSYEQNPSYADRDDEILLIVAYRVSRWGDGNFMEAYDALSEIDVDLKREAAKKELSVAVAMRERAEDEIRQKQAEITELEAKINNLKK